MKMNSLIFFFFSKNTANSIMASLGSCSHFVFVCAVCLVSSLLKSNPPSERNMKDLNIELLAIISDLSGLVYHVLLVCPPIRKFLITVHLLLLSVFTLIWNHNPAIFSSCLHVILLIW